MSLARGLTYIVAVISVSAVDLNGDHQLNNPEDAVDRFFQRTAGESETALHGEAQAVRVDAHGNTEETQKPIMRSQSSSETVSSAAASSSMPGSKPPALRLMTSRDSAYPGMLVAEHERENLGQYPGAGVGASASMGGAGSGLGMSGGTPFGMAGAPSGPGTSFMMSPCQIPQWLSGDFLCTEANTKSDKVFKVVDPVTGSQKQHMRDGAVCTTQCVKALWYDVPVLRNLTCTHGYWLDHTQRNVVVFKCQMSSTYSNMCKAGLVLACILLYCCCQVRQGKNPMPEFMKHMHMPPVHGHPAASADAAAAAASSSPAPEEAIPKSEHH